MRFPYNYLKDILKLVSPLFNAVTRSRSTVEAIPDTVIDYVIHKFMYFK